MYGEYIQNYNYSNSSISCYITLSHWSAFENNSINSIELKGTMNGGIQAQKQFKIEINFNSFDPTKGDYYVKSFNFTLEAQNVDEISVI